MRRAGSPLWYVSGVRTKSAAIFNTPAIVYKIYFSLIGRNQELGVKSQSAPPHRFRSKANRDNAYLIDRAVQKSETFTGIDGINVQDRAIQESMGAICDRSQEHLGPADKGIIQMRRLLREAINAVRAGGTPAGVAPSYYDLYCALQVLPRDANWRHILAPDIAPEKILQTV